MSDITSLLKAKVPMTLARVADGYAALLACDLARLVAHQAGRRMLWIASDDVAMQALGDGAAIFAPEVEVIAFPAWDCLPYDRAGPSLRASAARMAALARLQASRADSRAQLIITTANAITQRTLTPFRVRQLSAHIKAGTRMDRDALAALLSAQGYSRVDTVADHGEYAVRGGLIDLFPAGEELGYRLDFFGDEVESLRRFDPQDQRSCGNADALTLLPAAETLLDEPNIKRFRTGYRDLFGTGATSDPLYQAVSEGRRQAGMDHWLPLFEERMDSLFDHLGDDVLAIRDLGSIAAIQSRFEAIDDYHANRIEAAKTSAGSYRPLAPEQLYLGGKEWKAAIAHHRIHLATPFDEPEGAHVIDLATHAARDFTPERIAEANVYDALVEYLAQERAEGRKTIIASASVGSRDRLIGLMRDHGALSIVDAESWQAAVGQADRETAVAVVLPIEHGFATETLCVVSEQDILGDRLIRRIRKRKSADAFLAEMSTLSVGDHVVHRDHGIGRYEGLISIPVGDGPHDCVWLTYSNGDKLFVPVENLDVLSRYGGESEGVTLDRLGGEAWQRRRSRMKARIREIAGELLATAAERALRSADIAAQDACYPEFVARFPYSETDDQESAIADVLADLSSGKPMDRLVCGDVGFGKTEVALRAAHVAAMAGMQVAIVCPTTLLARQHYSNFVERFKGFPVHIGRLSRLVPAAEAKAVREGLTSGQIDVVIGTHALLAKGIAFNRLGLVIVDEEQRFGVVHKERLKALKTDVHVLTLTATPIPRTLQMAMSGLRDLSIIKTPPVDRLAVRTYVIPWDPVVLREALLREHHRGGQSFFVTPRIADLPEIEEFLRKSAPEIRYVVAHGQMAAGEVEARMSAFYDRRYDVLVSTTIVESGLDIPNANTMIIHRGDRFGLAQLYQLRGRVGRSKTRAYAYLTTPQDRIVTETAEKRLKILLDLDTLGAGFQLASHDLDIRGAGNLVGDEQSGHIREVGFELYQSMLEEAILAARAEGAGLAVPDERFSPAITLDAPISLPETYIPDLGVRMGLYRRLNDLGDRAEIDSFAAEMIDRFGPLPDATQNLLTLMEIKLGATHARIAKLDIGPKGALVAFHNDRPPNIDGLIAYAQRLHGTAKLRPDSKLAIMCNWPTPQARLGGALQLSRGLAKLADH
ncbi:MAG: transcription-repair coupling factor [Sphingopyxis sp.]